MHPSRFLTHRLTVTLLIAGLLAASLAAALVPQRAATTPAALAAWQQRHPLAAPMVQALALDRVATAPWFLGLLAVTLAAIAASLFHHGRRLYRHPSRRAWGVMFLHLGLGITVIGGLAITGWRQDGVLPLSIGETTAGESFFLSHEHGVLAAPLRLDHALTLEDLESETWEDGSLRRLAATLRVGDRRLTLTSARPRYLAGTRYRLTGEFGRAFFLVIDDKAKKRHQVVLQIPRPQDPGDATWAYGSFTVPGIPYPLEAKYPLRGNNGGVEVVVRLRFGDQELGRVGLVHGRPGKLGRYTVTLTATRPWAAVALHRAPGTGLVLAGFAGIVLGGALLYLFPRVPAPGDHHRP